MSDQSRRLAGILLVVFPTVIFGGVSLLGMLIDGRSGYVENPLRQDLWRAGHAHAGVLLILSLVALRYVDQAALPERLKGSCATRSRRRRSSCRSPSSCRCSHPRHGSRTR